MRRLVKWMLLFVMIMALLMGCKSKPEGNVSNPEDKPVVELQDAVAPPEIIEITISAVGDVTLGVNQKSGYAGSFNEYYDKYGGDYFLKNVKDIFMNDDFTIAEIFQCLFDCTQNLFAHTILMFLIFSLSGCVPSTIRGF